MLVGRSTERRNESWTFLVANELCFSQCPRFLLGVVRLALAFERIRTFRYMRNVNIERLLAFAEKLRPNKNYFDRTQLTVPRVRKIFYDCLAK